MGKRGPAPEPTRLKVLKGNPGKRPLNKDEPKPTVGVGSPPAWLDRMAKLHWKELQPELERIGVLTIADRPGYTMLCQAWSEWRKSVRMMGDNDAIFVAKSGYTQVTGYVSMERQRKQDYQKLAAKFGLTPSDRTTIKAVAPPKPNNDPLGLVK